MSYIGRVVATTDLQQFCDILLSVYKTNVELHEEGMYAWNIYTLQGRANCNNTTPYIFELVLSR